MFDRKQAKVLAKKSLKRNYITLVFVCLMAAFLGISGESTLTMLSAQSQDSEQAQQTAGEQTNILYEFSRGNIAVLVDGKNIITDDLDKAQKAFDKNKSKSFKLGSVEFSFADGEFAKIANMFVTGSYITTIYKAVNNMTGSSTAAIIIVIAVSLVLRLMLIFFVLNVLEVIMARLFLESGTYEKLPPKSWLFLIRSKRWLHTSVTLLLKNFYHALWSLTIVGGIVKYYSYFLVPYIVAENPAIGANEAITLSRRMMKGHKLELFKLQLTFLGWIILGALTFGLAAVFFVNPYVHATYAQFYRSMRASAKETGVENAEKLCDTYLHQKADDSVLTEAYSDIESLTAQTESFDRGFTGARAFFANVFGIVGRYTEQTEAIDKNEVAKIIVSQFKNELRGNSYPSRLSPVKYSQKRDRLSTVFYTRSYSVTSLILMFFIGSFIGWLWEFIYKYVEIGKFVNRGVMHGPWLPIYGSGAVMILVALKKFRKNPVAEFFTAIVLCGIVEYFTAYILEVTHDGQKWWDYSGYFLNIDGRVCAEGLMVFGIGGVAFVYFAAPMLDNLIRKISTKTAVILCIALTAVFAADFVYSQMHPNQGEGITDYQTVSTIDNTI